MLKFLRIGLLSAGALFAFGALAQPGPDDDAQSASADQPDPPSRVARLAFIRGAVSFVPAGENDWVEAQVNRPLITGDKLWTDHDSRAELEIGSSAIRIDEQTMISQSRRSRPRRSNAAGFAEPARAPPRDNQITGDRHANAGIRAQPRPANFPVTVAGRPATTVSVLHGGGDARRKRRAPYRGRPVGDFQDSALRDSLYRFAAAAGRVRQFIASATALGRRALAPAVSEDVIGYQDLDDNGDWRRAGIRRVWYPTTVAVGWTPRSLRSLGFGRRVRLDLDRRCAGASRLSTTDAGPTSATAGAGARVDRRAPVRTGARSVHRRRQRRHRRRWAS